MDEVFIGGIAFKDVELGAACEGACGGDAGNDIECGGDGIGGDDG